MCLGRVHWEGYWKAATSQAAFVSRIRSPSAKQVPLNAEIGFKWKWISSSIKLAAALGGRIIRHSE